MDLDNADIESVKRAIENLATDNQLDRIKSLNGRAWHEMTRFSAFEFIEYLEEYIAAHRAIYTCYACDEPSIYTDKTCRECGEELSKKRKVIEAPETIRYRNMDEMLEIVEQQILEREAEAKKGLFRLFKSNGFIRHNRWLLMTITLIFSVLIFKMPSCTEKRQAYQPSIKKNSPQIEVDNLQKITGQSIKDATRSLEILKAVGEDNKNGYKLVSLMVLEGGNVNKRLELASEIKLIYSNSHNLVKIIAMTSVIAREKGISASPEEILKGVLNAAPSAVKTNTSLESLFAFFLILMKPEESS